MRHDTAATEVVAKGQELARKEAALEELQRSVHELQEARHALQVRWRWGTEGRVELVGGGKGWR